jgi:hypothetical protein
MTASESSNDLTAATLSALHSLTAQRELLRIAREAWEHVRATVPIGADNLSWSGLAHSAYLTAVGEVGRMTAEAGASIDSAANGLNRAIAMVNGV